MPQYFPRSAAGARCGRIRKHCQRIAFDPHEHATRLPTTEHEAGIFPAPRLDCSRAVATPSAKYDLEAERTATVCRDLERIARMWASVTAPQAPPTAPPASDYQASHTTAPRSTPRRAGAPLQAASPARTTRPLPCSDRRRTTHALQTSGCPDVGRSASRGTATILNRGTASYERMRHLSRHRPRTRPGPRPRVHRVPADEPAHGGFAHARIARLQQLAERLFRAAA